jgi:hypothetical protein
MSWIAAKWNSAKISPASDWMQTSNPGDVVNAAAKVGVAPATAKASAT